MGFKFYCTEPQKSILSVDNYNHVEIKITASDNWQKMVIKANTLVNRFSKKPMNDWSKAGTIHFAPKQGSDITKVIFSAAI